MMKFILTSTLFLIRLIGVSIVLLPSWVMVVNAQTDILTSIDRGYKNSDLLHSSTAEPLPINPILTDLLGQLKKVSVNNNTVELTLAKLTLSKQKLNTAEQYLLQVVKALWAEKNMPAPKNSERIIALLAPIAELAEQIPTQQLSEPAFLQRHLLLAEHYSKQQHLDLAYLEKKYYLEKYHIYRYNKRLALITSIEQSFEIKAKQANNDLLKSQNELKISQVERILKQKDSQHYNFLIILSTAAVFVLLFVREFSIRKRLIKLSKVDNLTGLMNRNTLFEQGDKIVASFADKPNNFSVLLIDIDHFKKINELDGHQVGDQVLKKMAQLIAETMRSRDIFSRLGGEEFVALLPYADNNQAKAIAMRIHDKISSYDFSGIMSQNKLSVSIGVASMIDENMSFDDILHGADLAMYQAKELGRNRVVCYHAIAEKQERRSR